MLQEVHCSVNTTDIWSAEWGYKAIYSGCSSRQAGVAVLFNNNFNLQILKLLSDPEGRFIICNIKADEKELTLANIYAPNKDDPTFFQNFFDPSQSFQCEDIIIGGDFNLVLDIQKDKKGGLPKTHKNSLKILIEFSENLNLTDVWRTLNPEARRYTWRQKRRA